MLSAPPPPDPPALVAALHGAHSPRVDEDSERPSLEALLRHARAEREARLAALRPVVAELMRRIEDLGPKGPQATRRDLLEALDELDPAGAELLVPWLDPAAQPAPETAPRSGGQSGGKPGGKFGARKDGSLIVGSDTGSRFRAEETCRALQDLATLATVGPLVELSTDGTPAGRANALFVLGRVPNCPPVVPALGHALLDPEPSVRDAATLALGLRPEAAAVPLLAKALEDSEAGVAATALAALAARSDGSAPGPVVTFAADRDRAAGVLGALVAYYAAHPADLGDAELDAVLALLYDVRATSGDQVLLLELLADSKAMGRADRRRALETAAASRNPTVRDAARVTLALLGDRTAKKELLAGYDDAIDQRPRNYKVYAERGSMYLRLRDYDRAVRDFKKGLDQEIENEAARRGLTLFLARAYALDGKLSRSADALEEAWLSRKELRALALDPDFAELAAHPRYGKVLQ